MNKFIYFPDVRQNTCFNCGVVSTQAILAYYGIEYSEPQLQKDLKTSKKWGTATRNIVNFFKYKKFQIEYGTFTEGKVKKYLHANIPVMILIQAWGPDRIDYRHTNQYGHYVVVSGYNERGFIIEDPAIFGRGIITYSNLKKRWHADDDGLLKNFGIAVWGIKPYDYSKFYPIG